jgi:adenosylmethionine-8-amino-7-oxononanoate aminotransferase
MYGKIRERLQKKNKNCGVATATEPREFVSIQETNSDFRRTVMKLNEHHYFVRDLGRDYPVAVKAEGSWIWDEAGNKYLDGCASANVVSIGHGRAEVGQSMASQAAQVAYVPPMHFLNRPTIELSKKLVEMAPPGFNRVMLLSGGSEAMENAFKIARQYHVYNGTPSKYRIVSRWQGFHGNTLTADAVSGKTNRRTIQTPMLMDVPHIVPACCYRCAYEKSYPGCGLMCAKDLERVMVQEGPEYIAAFTAETIVGAAAGAVTPVREYYPKIREICDRHNVLWIADEVMTGMGRTGKFAAIEHWGVLPDLIVLAKGLSSGYAPLAAIMIHDRVFDVFGRQGLPYVGGHTYNAHPVTAAAGLAVLEYVEKNHLMQQAGEKEPLMESGLRAIAKKVPMVGDVRGKGLMWGLEFVRDRRTKQPFETGEKVFHRVVSRALAKGLVIYPVNGCVDGEKGDGVLICPPLTISGEEIAFLLERLEQSLAEINNELGVQP